MGRCATVALLALVLAACGGSGKSTYSSAPSSSSTTSTTTTAASSTSGGAASTATALGTSTRPPEVPANHPTKTTSADAGRTTPAGGATNVHVRASFTILSGGLRPPELTVPAFVAVGLTVLSGDGRSHRIVIRTPVPRSVNLPAGGRVTIPLPGTRAGRYALEIDGKAAGSLLVGGEGGP
jgi:hypothetical protein